MTTQSVTELVRHELNLSMPLKGDPDTVNRSAGMRALNEMHQSLLDHKRFQIHLANGEVPNEELRTIMGLDRNFYGALQSKGYLPSFMRMMQQASAVVTHASMPNADDIVCHIDFIQEHELGKNIVGENYMQVRIFIVTGSVQVTFISKNYDRREGEAQEETASFERIL